MGEHSEKNKALAFTVNTCTDTKHSLWIWADALLTVSFPSDSFYFRR